MMLMKPTGEQVEEEPKLWVPTAWTSVLSSGTSESLPQPQFSLHAADIHTFQQK